MKKAITKYPVIDLIKSRWSPRSFSDKDISKDDLFTIIEAGSWAFSGNNSQPWKYFFVMNKDNESFNEFVDCLSEGNKIWARNSNILMVALIKKLFDDGKENKWAKHDLGAANATLALQALSMGIYVHPMAGFNADKISLKLGIDKNEYEPLVFFAIGYLDTPEKLPEPFKTRELTPRKRKDLSEILTEFKIKK